jgi:drug/metabolite transporter (DMT)-like permease
MPAGTPIHSSMTLREWLLLAFLSVLWGGSFFFNAIGLTALPPLTLVLARVVLAALALWAVIAALGVAVPRAPAIWRAFLVMGVINNALPFSLIVWGQAHIASGLAAILNASTPLFTVLLAHVLTTDERLTANRVAGVLAGLAGIAVMFGDAAAEAAGASVAAQLACLAAALSYALAGIYGRRFRAMGVAPLATAAGQVTCSSLVLLPLALVMDRPWTLGVPGLPVVGAILALALLSTALAYVVFFRLLATAGATNLLLVTFLVPVTAVALGRLVLGEVLEAHQVLGAALVGLGLVAIDGRLLRRLRASLRA